MYRTMIERCAVAALAGWIAGCAPQPAASSNRPPMAAPGTVEATGCKIDSAKICQDAKSGGTLEESERPMGMASTMNQAELPSTARLEIPNGPTLQAMCYFDPRHTTLAKSDVTPSAPLDANAVAYLRGKGLCASQ